MDSVNNIKTTLLSDITQILKCEEDFVSQVNQLLNKYKNVEDIENLMIHTIDVYDNEFLFFKQIQKKFKYILLSCNNNINTKGFQNSMNY